MRVSVIASVATEREISNPVIHKPQGGRAHPMKRIYQAGNLQDAYILSNLLSAARIDHHVLNSYQHGGVGELPFTHTYPEIWLVNENDESKARALIAEFEQPLANETPERVCSRCGELNPATFQICWHCGDEI